MEIDLPIDIPEEDEDVYTPTSSNIIIADDEIIRRVPKTIMRLTRYERAAVLEYELSQLKNSTTAGIPESMIPNFGNAKPIEIAKIKLDNGLSNVLIKRRCGSTQVEVGGIVRTYILVELFTVNILKNGNYTPEECEKEMRSTLDRLFSP